MTDTNDVRHGSVSSPTEGTLTASNIKREEIETSLDTWIDVDQFDSKVTRCATCVINATHDTFTLPTQTAKAEESEASDSASQLSRAAGNAGEPPSSVDEVLTTADLEALLAACPPNFFTSQSDMQSAAHAVIQHLVDQSENALPSHNPPPIQMSRPVKPCDTQRLHYFINGEVVTPADFPDAEDILREIFTIPSPKPLSFDSIPDAAHLFRNQECSDRPPYKNAELAALAIYTHERRMATLHEIREIVTRRYPSLKETSFKDSLRHLLSYDASFVKIPQTESNGGPRGGGDYWALNIEMWGQKKRSKLRNRAPPKPKPEPRSRPAKTRRSAKSRKTDKLPKVEETSDHSSPNVDQYVSESEEESPRKRRKVTRIKVEDLDTGFDYSPVWLHDPWSASGPDEPTTPSSEGPTEVQMSDVVRLPLPPEPPTVWSLPSPPTETCSQDVDSSSPVLANDALSSGPMSVDSETFAPPISTPSAPSVQLPLTPPDTPEATASTSERAVLSLSVSSVTLEKPSIVLESMLVLPPNSTSIVEAPRLPKDHLALGRDPEADLQRPSLFPFSPPGPSNNEITNREGPSGCLVSKASDEDQVISLKRAHGMELRTVSAPKATKLSPTPEASKLSTRVTRSSVKKSSSIVKKKEPSKTKATATRPDTRPSLEADQVAVAVRQSLREKKKKRASRQW